MSSAAPVPTPIEDAVLTVAPRFCGPPGAGNGGYVAGSLAEHTGVRGPVEVTLRRPAPLGVRLAVRPGSEASPGTWRLEEESGARVAEARPHPEALREAPPELPGSAAIAAAPAGHEHPFPGCFVCGPARRDGDGLRILPVAVPRTSVAAALWTPAAELAGPGGFVTPAFVWAALDCPGYFAATLGLPRVPLLLGRMAAAITGPVRAGARLRVVGWALAHEGRRHLAATALVDQSDRIVARSRQVWIAPRAETA
jgi:hypothetical protein